MLRQLLCLHRDCAPILMFLTGFYGIFLFSQMSVIANILNFFVYPLLCVCTLIFLFNCYLLMVSFSKTSKINKNWQISLSFRNLLLAHHTRNV